MLRTGYRRLRPSSRRKWSKDTAAAPRVLVGGVEDGTRDAEIDAVSGLAACKTNGAFNCNPPTDHGSTKYSAVSADVLAAKVTHPESVATSVNAYWATLRDSGVPCAPHDGRLLLGPAEFLQAAATARPPMIVLNATHLCQLTIYTPRC